MHAEAETAVSGFYNKKERRENKIQHATKWQEYGITSYFATKYVSRSVQLCGCLLSIQMQRLITDNHNERNNIFFQVNWKGRGDPHIKQKKNQFHKEIWNSRETTLVHVVSSISKCSKNHNEFFFF